MKQEIKQNIKEAFALVIFEGLFIILAILL